jgi:hypothetical protein
MQIGTPEWSIWKFFRKIDENLRARELAKKWNRDHREQYNETKRKYLRKHNQKWTKKSRKENPERHRANARDLYHRTRTPENIARNRRYVSNWKKKNPEKNIEYMVRHFKKYGKKLGKPWINFQHELLTWASAVKSRDNYKCQICGEPAIHAHHIFYKRNQPQLVFNINNGISLCKIHHEQVHGINLLNK